MTSPTPHVLRGKHRIAAFIAQTLVFLGMTRTANRFSRWWTRYTCLQVFKQMEPETLVMLLTIVGSAKSDDRAELVAIGKRITSMMTALDKEARGGSRP